MTKITKEEIKRVVDEVLDEVFKEKQNLPERRNRFIKLKPKDK